TVRSRDKTHGCEQRLLAPISCADAVVMEIRIYYEDTDCGGVVYYANYLKYFERARTDYLEQRGLSVAKLAKEGTVFMVVRAELAYHSPARLGDTLSIHTLLSEQGKASLVFSHVIKEKT